MTDNTSCAFSIADFSERNGICATTTYKEIKSGRLVARKIGRRTVITDDAERSWRNSLPRFRAKAKSGDESFAVADA